MFSPYDFHQIVPWLAAAMFVAGAALLATVVRKLIRLLKEAEIFRVPLAERQEVAFSAAGRVVLCAEGPLLTRRFGSLSFALESSGGESVPGSDNWFRATSTSFSKARMQMQSYRIPRPGRYVLRIQCLGAPRPEDAEHAIVFVKPHLAGVVGCVLGIIAAAWLLIGGIVLFALGFSTAG